MEFYILIKIKKFENLLSKISKYKRTMENKAISKMNKKELYEKCMKQQEEIQKLSLFSDNNIDNLKDEYEISEIKINRLEEENEKLKEEKNKYFSYLKDKDLECEECRERADYNENTITQKVSELEELQQKYNKLYELF